MSPDPRAERGQPLVSIGLPTFNRGRTLQRAIESALGQTHRNVELVISDNASTDETEALCRHYARRDERVRYLRADTNLGAVANFNATIASLRGEFATLLADDDWFDPDYVERCLLELRERPGHVLVSGLARHHRGAEVCGRGQSLDLHEADPVERIARYLADVEDNGIFYGLMPARVMKAAAPLRPVLAGDWIFVAAVLGSGAGRTVDTTRLNRSVGGASASLADSVRAMRVGSRTARVAHFHAAGIAFADMAWASAAYAHLPAARRLRLALRCAPKLIRWRDAAWLLIGPTMLASRRRPRGRLAWALFEALARRAGAFSRGVPPV